MARKKAVETVDPKTTAKADGGSQSLQVVMKEYDALREMYTHALQNGQTMFNYYLTLMTAVFGGIALIFQPSTGVFMPRAASSLLLIFFAIVGSFYLSSLTTNFAHATRYARGVNELRRFMIERYAVSMPPIYARFMAEKTEEKPSKSITLLSLFIPVNTHQLFTATINSLSWAFAIAIVYSVVGGGSQIILRGVLAFAVTYVIYSVYAGDLSVDGLALQCFDRALGERNRPDRLLKTRQVWNTTSSVPSTS